MNPDRTDGVALISSYESEPATADSEFLLSMKEYRENTGGGEEGNVIAYQLRQSFKPGEVSAEEANRISYELAMCFTKGNHAFIVATHLHGIEVEKSKEKERHRDEE